MKWMIFEHGWQGHRLEYLHHKYMFAGQNMQNDSIIFVLNPKITQRKDLMNWPNFPNITIDYIDENEAKNLKFDKKISSAYQYSKLLKKYSRKHNPNRVIINEFIRFIPFLPFLFPNKENFIRGIIYSIPRYRKGWMNKIIHTVILRMLVNSKSIERIWLLNDTSSPYLYNHKYSVSKFAFLPDPINITNNIQITMPDISRDLHDKTVFLHAGGMGQRKGTFTIIEAIKLMTEDELKNKVFIFAGPIDNAELKDTMNEFINNYSSKTAIYLWDSFIPFENLAGFFKIADCILIPYTNVGQSSGILGYSAYFNKPVIGPQEGLLGKLISSYKLGSVINDITPEKLKDEMIKYAVTAPNDNTDSRFNEYVANCAAEKFASISFSI